MDKSLSSVAVAEPADITNRTTILTDIFVFLDTSWEYRHVVDYVNYVVERLNINPYGSSITLLAARDGSVMVNRTFYISDFYSNWNVTTHSNFRNGFSLPLILSKARDLTSSILSSEQIKDSMGGRSIVALLIPSPIAFVHEYDFDYCQRYVERLNATMPELKFIFYAGGAVIRFTDYVSNPKEDLFPLDYDVGVEKCAQPVVNRIRGVPRQLSNPRCTSQWTNGNQAQTQLVQYQELGKITFYAMPPNYFYHDGSMRYLKVKPLSSVAFIVCTSRSLKLPYRNPSAASAEGQDCKQITTNDYSYDLTAMCNQMDQLLDCPPLYISVQSQDFATTAQALCTEKSCPTPMSAQYSIIVNNLDCTNRGRTMETSHSILLMLSLLFLSVNPF